VPWTGVVVTEPAWSSAPRNIGHSSPAWSLLPGPLERQILAAQFANADVDGLKQLESTACADIMAVIASRKAMAARQAAVRGSFKHIPFIESLHSVFYIFGPRSHRPIPIWWSHHPSASRRM
jgi:hypothetical protein